MAARPNHQQRLSDVWTWLPAFRAVAEVQHVQRAAKDLRLTASSLSRAIGLLESHLGRKLFDRVGRNVKLNALGETLLASLRDGMRSIDDGIAQVTGSIFVGEIRVACEGDQPASFAWRAALRLQKKHGELRTTIERVGRRQGLTTRLLRGELDLAIVSRPPIDASMLVEPIGSVSYGIYCGRGHPLHTSKNATPTTIRKHAFVAPVLLDEDSPRDQWPVDLERIVTLRVSSLEPAIAACASGEFLAVLPDVAVADSSERARLRRLPSGLIPSLDLFVVRRRPLAEIDRVSAFVIELLNVVPETMRGRRGREKTLKVARDVSTLARATSKRRSLTGKASRVRR